MRNKHKNFLFKNFIGNGLCVSRNDNGDEVIIEVKMGVVLLPDNNNSTNVAERRKKEGKQPIKEKHKKSKLRESRQHKKKVVATSKSWKRFNSDEL